MIGLEDVRAAAGRIEGHVVRTPVLHSPAIDEAVGAEVLLKAEHLQVGGAFKLRGALNNALARSPHDLRHGLVAVSSGNHAQAVARAAAIRGTTALLLMPEDAPESKRAATLVAGGLVETFDRYSTDREALLAERARATGRLVVHPYDDPLTMAGQGTVALELLEDVAPGGPVDDLFVPVGGGGLAAGCATAAAALLPGCRVHGVEPAAGDDVRRSLAAGERVTIEVPRTIADGQQTTSPGVHPFEVLQARLTDVVTVSDEEIVAAMRMAARHLGAVLEPSGACALAALLTGRVRVGGRVGVVLSGGNVDAARYRDLVGLDPAEVTRPD
ncbi:threonine/serine dehydratase [Nocardioides marmoribigeumensis]|uniref:Threonine dehydratase n=1 Tax=Nocardioides marmoribigeumensis TaxID=433649 RepID=A0ABU2C084_9ACTN|nr:threonine/serine dehydratase [Nocardioides marmoribigeumensis]MDR7364024.1 threonine dehydratase [Nocardioides marmoribigeumensis]